MAFAGPLHFYLGICLYPADSENSTGDVRFRFPFNIFLFCRQLEVSRRVLSFPDREGILPSSSKNTFLKRKTHLLKRLTPQNHGSCSVVSKSGWDTTIHGRRHGVQ